MADVHSFNATGNGTLDYIGFVLYAYRQDPELARQVDVTPLPSPIRRRVDHHVAYKACYHNAELAIKANRGGKYVLGFWQHLIPVEHAWVRFGETYHDPTAEILCDGEGQYVAVVELELAQVQEIRRAIGTRNHLDLCGYFRWLQIEQHKAKEAA